MESVRYMANVITSANLMLGTVSILLAILSKFVPAAWVIFLAFICDIADGKIARMADGTSTFGQQCDSLADLVSFILAPCVLVFTFRRPEFFIWRLLACLLIVFCGAFRLARFNTESESKAAFFNGLPSPAFGLGIASGVLLLYRYNLAIEPRIVSIAAAFMAVMMVSQVKYPSFKDAALLHWKYLLFFGIVFALLFVIPEITVFLLVVTYIVGMPIKMNMARSGGNLI